MKPVKLSVSKIIALVMRSGDIDSRFDNGSSMNRGSAAHRKIQRAAISDSPGYTKEVSLKLETEIDGTPVIIHGRADGIITKPAIMIDEIKTTTLPLDYIYNQHPQHLGQAKCYAYMYIKTLENPIESISIQLTYYQLESEEIRHYHWSFTTGELEDFFYDLINKYGQWLRLEREWGAIRNQSIAQTPFPFETYRKGQRELAVAVYRVISQKKKLYTSAPTGIGKTLSTIFPSIKALGEDKAEKIFYLTAKTVTRVVAEDAIRLMAQKGLRIKSITLRAKDKICPNEQPDCDPDYCPHAKGHYDRLNDAVMDLLKNIDLITPDITSEYAKKHTVCPHEYALEISLWCDVIIGDYNHVFDPAVHLRRFFSDEGGEYIFLIDEAHNLADRVRDMYTAAITKSSFSKILNAIRGRDPQTSALRMALRNICAHLKELREKIDWPLHHISKDPDTKVLELVVNFIQTSGEWLMSQKNNPGGMYEEVLNLYFETNHYVMISDLYNSHYTTIYEAQSNDITMTLFCLDPSEVIATGLNRGQASILFSATFTPLNYYRDILGGTPEDFTLSLPSPFDPTRLATIIHQGISTKYAHREQSYQPISTAIHTAISHKPGNYLIFFPSYDYMHKVYEIFIHNYPEVTTQLQETHMTEEDREAFLEAFTKKNKITRIGFAVLGGIFSEGIDLKGDRLIGSIIVSVGLPKINLRQDQIRDYFNQKNGQGYDYAYVFPGMNKVLQAAGRVIRTETDFGVVLLIDNRFATPEYKRLLPHHWINMQTIHNLDQLSFSITKHWQQVQMDI
ncbi:MAG: ATP-dependent DNA helicase [Defluviitaleaceae bacterium]|nr:ATP-dependent DNA helicase [Defluviitaleaceae bacterium]